MEASINIVYESKALTSSNEGNDASISLPAESFLDRMQNEKRIHKQSIEILHRRRPTREQLQEAGILKPVYLEDILQEKKKKKKKNRKKKKKKKDKTKCDEFGPGIKMIMNDDKGTAWDNYHGSKPPETPETQKTDEDEDEKNKQLTLTQNNLQQHNKLYSINGKGFVIHKFLEQNNEEIVKSDNINYINKSKSKCKPKSRKTKLTKTETPKLSNNNKVNKDLKPWMVKNSVWDQGLYSYLILNDILSLHDISLLNQTKFDRIMRQFRVEQFAKRRNKKSRNHIDKILIKFEKSWRKSKKKKKKKKK